MDKCEEFRAKYGTEQSVYDLAAKDKQGTQRGQEQCDEERRKEVEERQRACRDAKTPEQMRKDSEMAKGYHVGPSLIRED